MRKFFLTVLVIVSACASESNEPEDLIPKEKMITLLTEVHILEAKIKGLKIRPSDSANVVYDHYEKLLFADFNISQEQYERSFNYYVDNTTEFKKVYDAVVDTLMRREKIQKD